MREVVGEGLAKITRRWQFETDWRVPCGPVDDVNALTVVVQELLDTRKQLLNIKASVANKRLDEVPALAGRSLIVSRGTHKIGELYRSDCLLESKKTLYDEALFVIATNATLRATTKALPYFSNRSVAQGDAHQQPTMDISTKKFNTFHLTEYILLLEEAVETNNKNDIVKARFCQRTRIPLPLLHANANHGS